MDTQRKWGGNFDMKSQLVVSSDTEQWSVVVTMQCLIIHWLINKYPYKEDNEAEIANINREPAR